MPVIKSTNVPSSVAPFSMRDIEQQARAMLLRARHQAESLLGAAQAEAEQLKASAKTEGLAEGRREGLAAGQKEGLEAAKREATDRLGDQIKTALAALTAAATALDKQRQQLEAEGLQEVVKLALSIARRVTKRQAAVDPDVLAANLAEAMKLVVQTADVRIAVHPEQRKTVDDLLPRLRLSWPQLEHVAIEEDATLSPGGCRISTRHGHVDADLDGQLDRIAADLLPSPEGAAS